MHTIHNARITLLATAFNNLAIAVIAAAFIVPAVTGAFATTTIWAIVKTTVWLVLGFALHGSGQIVLWEIALVTGQEVIVWFILPGIVTAVVIAGGLFLSRRL